MLAVVAPGQGSQTPGFLTPWFEYFDAQGDFFANVVAGWSQNIGLDLRHLGTQANADEIKSVFKTDPDIKRALSSYLKDHEDADDDEDYEDDDFDEDEDY